MIIELPDALEVARRQEGIDLSGEDGDAYGPEIDAARNAINRLEGYISELQALKAHTHEWSDSGFCMTCGADGNA